LREPEREGHPETSLVTRMWEQKYRPKESKVIEKERDEKKLQGSHS
jgi:hypothetical protein